MRYSPKTLPDRDDCTAAGFGCHLPTQPFLHGATALLRKDDLAAVGHHPPDARSRGPPIDASPSGTSEDRMILIGKADSSREGSFIHTVSYIELVRPLEI